MRIALDAMGGDYAPQPNIAGALAALQEEPDLQISLVGDPQQLERALIETGSADDRISIVESEGVVGMEEKPTVALRQKKNCSIAVCWRMMANKEVDAVVSAGNTGAVVAAGLRTRLFLKGIKRPGIAVTLPTATGRSVLLDVGANPAARPEHLFQYGIMGKIFAHEFLEIEAPRVGLMNIGSEEGKGNDLYREANALLTESSLFSESYIGNVEGRGLYRGEADVLVCEGFVGNVVLKVSEGFAGYMLKTLATEVTSQLDVEREKAAALFQNIGKQYHYNQSGGAPLLGIDGICIIAHGSSDSIAITNALKAAITYNKRDINSQIVKQLAVLKGKSA